MNSVRRSQQGFTLVEVLVALTIFAVGLLSIAGMQITAIQTNSSANTLTSATAYAEGALEEILSRPLGDPTFAADSADNAWTLVSHPPYNATFDVDVNYNDVPNVARVSVTVTGARRTVTLVGFKRTV